MSSNNDKQDLPESCATFQTEDSCVWGWGGGGTNRPPQKIQEFITVNMQVKKAHLELPQVPGTGIKWASLLTFHMGRLHQESMGELDLEHSSQVLLREG